MFTVLQTLLQSKALDPRELYLQGQPLLVLEEACEKSKAHREALGSESHPTHRALFATQAAMDTIRETASETGKAVDSGVRAASELLLSGAHEAAAQYGAAQERSERFMNTATAHYRSTEEAAFNKLKGPVLHVCWHLVMHLARIG